jgi:chaperonin GroES
MILEDFMNLRPLNDRIVVEPLEQDDKTTSGLYIPESAKEKPQQGRVVAAGPGARDDAGKRIVMDVAEGDTVLFAKYAGTEVKIDGTKYLIMKETDVLGIVLAEKAGA